jgi:hypothetical protein
MRGSMKSKKQILVVAVIVITVAVLYFGGVMLIEMMNQMHVRPPH